MVRTKNGPTSVTPLMVCIPRSMTAARCPVSRSLTRSHTPAYALKIAHTLTLAHALTLAPSGSLALCTRSRPHATFTLSRSHVLSLSTSQPLILSAPCQIVVSKTPICSVSDCAQIVVSKSNLKKADTSLYRTGLPARKHREPLFFV